MHRRSLALAAALVVTALAVASACQDPTQIVVSLSTNVDCSGTKSPTFAGAHLAVLRDGTVLDGSEAAIPREACNAGSLGSVTVVPGDTGTDATVRIRAVARLGNVAGGTTKEARDCFTTMGPDCIVSSRSLKFVSHQSLAIPIFLDSACAGVTCPEKQTCGPGGKCIGEDEQPPIPDAGGDTSVPPIDAGRALIATAIYAGGDRTCADTPDGFYCWGQGFGTQPTRTPQFDGTIKMAIASTFLCALTKLGLTCYGSNGRGELGTTSKVLTSNTVTFADPNVETWLDVSVGAHHACAIGDSAKVGKPIVVCWGDQTAGQVTGIVDPAPALPTWAQKGDLSFIDTPLSIGSAATTNCVNAAPFNNPTTCKVGLGSCYDLVCWGANDLSQCARPLDADPTPRFAKSASLQVNLTTPFTLTGGARHIVALSGKSGFGWGDSSSSQLWDASDAGPSILPRVSGLPDFAGSALSLAAGEDFTCGALGTNVVCRGGTTLKGPFPPSTAVAAGAHHLCMLSEKGTVYCEGANDVGQLGVPNAKGIVQVTF